MPSGRMQIVDVFQLFFLKGLAVSMCLHLHGSIRLKSHIAFRYANEPGSLDILANVSCQIRLKSCITLSKYRYFLTILASR